MAWTYKLRYVRCGKKGCRPCQSGMGHGPYWYGYEHVDGGMRTRYFGKLPPEAVFAKAPPEPKPDPRWVFRGKMDLTVACRILGLKPPFRTTDLTKRWRELVFEHHPDKGGDTAICAAINAAYAYAKVFAG